MDLCPIAIHRNIYQNIPKSQSSPDWTSVHCLVSLCLICLLSIAEESLYCTVMFSSCKLGPYSSLGTYLFISFDWQLYSDTDAGTDFLIPKK